MAASQLQYHSKSAPFLYISIEKKGDEPFGVVGVGRGASSGASSQASEKSIRAASVTDRSSDLGMNIFILVRRFST